MTEAWKLEPERERVAEAGGAEGDAFGVKAMTRRLLWTSRTSAVPWMGVLVEVQ